MRLLSLQDIVEIKGISYSKGHIYRLIRCGKFPRPIKLGGGGRSAWAETEIDQYIQGRIADRDGNIKASSM